MKVEVIPNPEINFQPIKYGLWDSICGWWQSRNVSKDIKTAIDTSDKTGQPTDVKAISFTTFRNNILSNANYSDQRKAAIFNHLSKDLKAKMTEGLINYASAAKENRELVNKVFRASISFGRFEISRKDIEDKLSKVTLTDLSAAKKRMPEILERATTRETRRFKGTIPNDQEYKFEYINQDLSQEELLKVNLKEANIAIQQTIFDLLEAKCPAPNRKQGWGVEVKRLREALSKPDSATYKFINVTFLTQKPLPPKGPPPTKTTKL